MSEDIKQHLSALIDGELDRDAQRFLLKRMESDSELRATWSRYQLMRQALRRQEGPVARADFASGVMAALAAEPAVRVRRYGWLKMASGGAIAASVAVVALMASQPPVNVATGPATTSPPAVAAAAPATPTAPAVAAADPRVAAPPVVLMPRDEKTLYTQPAAMEISDSGAPLGYDPRMNSYVIRHYEASGQVGRAGAVPYVLLEVRPRPQAAPAANAPRPNESR